MEQDGSVDGMSGKRFEPPAPELLALARAIRRVRRAQELSQEALAAMADINPKHLSEIERANKDPRSTTVVRIADALGVPASELFACCEEAAREDARQRGS